MDFFESNELACLAVTPFKDLTDCVSECVERQNESLTVAYVPSPSYGNREHMAMSIHVQGYIPFPAAGRNWDVSYPCLDSRVKIRICAF